MTAIAHAFADALTQAAASKGRLEVRHTERKDVPADLVELVLQDLRIPAENLVGAEGDGFKIALTALDSGRITIAAVGVGIAAAALEVENMQGRTDALRGVSLTMYLLLVLTAVSWCTYGFLIHDFIVSAPNFIIIPCGVVVVAKAWSVRHAAV